MARCTPSALALTLVAVSAVSVQTARADVQHTVARGHTIETIARRYHVAQNTIMAANHLTDVKHLRVGEVLTIPGVKERTEGDTKRPHAEDMKKGEKSAKAAKSPGRETTTFAMKAKTPGVVHVHRLATEENFDIRVGEGHGHVPPTALRTFEKALRSPSGAAHAIDARLVSLLAIVSNHFGSRKVEVISGFRPFTPTQFNPHSNHMHGKAVDFRINGVPNEAVRDFCRTLRNTGCGYYPNSVFVHMDVRGESTYWIDYSKPGEKPRYNGANANADEGTSDVPHDGADGAPAAESAGDTQAPAESEAAPPALPPPDAVQAPAK
jgi:uncharacterized protein YcbK (DUF882 family)